MFDTGRYVLVPTKHIADIYRGSLGGPGLLAERNNFPRIEVRSISGAHSESITNIWLV